MSSGMHARELDSRRGATLGDRLLAGLVLASLSFGATARPLPALAGRSRESEIIEELTNQLNRPTASEVIAAFGGNPPARAMQGMDAKQFAQQVAPAIAQMEKNFPAATWAPLGRSPLGTADTIDAIYAMNGQPGRVVHGTVSSESFLRAKDADIAKYLEGLGVPLDPATIQTARPFVFFDGTSYSKNGSRGGLGSQLRASQSYIVMDVGFHEYVRRGGNPVDLVRKFSTVTFGNETDLAKYFTRQEKYVKGHPGEPPSAIESVLLPNVGHTSYWHSEFGPFRKQTDGTVKTKPLRDGDQPTKKQIIEGMLEVITLARDPVVLRAIQKECRKLGFDFSANAADPEAMKRFIEERRKAEAARYLELAATFADKLKRELPDLVSKLPVRNVPAESATPTGDGAKPAKEKYLSASAQSLREWLEGALDDFEGASRGSAQIKEAGVNSVTLNFINQATVALKTGKIRVRDYRRLLGFALSASEVNPRFLAAIQLIFRNEPEFEKQLVDKGDYFLTTFTEKSRKGTENTSAVYEKIQKHIGFVRRMEAAPAKAAAVE